MHGIHYGLFGTVIEMSGCPQHGLLVSKCPHHMGASGDAGDREASDTAQDERRGDGEVAERPDGLDPATTSSEAPALPDDE